MTKDVFIILYYKCTYSDYRGSNNITNILVPIYFIIIYNID